MMKQHLNEVVNIFNDSTSGIFNALRNIVPEADESFKWLDEHEELDIMYYVSFSGNKYISRFYNEMLEHNKTISDIANIVYRKFGDKWKRIYDAMMMEYNPINNYDMSEEEKVNSKIVSSYGTDAKTYGFNSPEAKPTDKTESSSTTEGSADDNVRQLTRSGNIGVTTSAQLLEGELKVRQNIFIEQVMKDIDSMLCLKLY